MIHPDPEESTDTEVTLSIKTKPKVVKPLLDRTYDPTFLYELCLDEVGRGCLFGRAYVGCVVLPKDPDAFCGKDIKDSKKFTSKQKIVEVAEYIKTHALAWHVAWIDANVIDDINILRSVMRGMHECIRETLVKLGHTDLTDCLAVVDGNYFTPYRRFDPVSETIGEMPSVTVEKGDAKYMGIAAASILAKVARDTWIAELCAEYPVLTEYYGLNTNMGYGTKTHLEGIERHGITQWHRKTFGKACQNATLNILDIVPT